MAYRTRDEAGTDKGENTDFGKPATEITALQFSRGVNVDACTPRRSGIIMNRRLLRCRLLHTAGDGADHVLLLALRHRCAGLLLALHDRRPDRRQRPSLRSHARGPAQVAPFVLAFGDGLHPVQWISNIFLHAGFMHLVGNMVFLCPFGELHLHSCWVICQDRAIATHIQETSDGQYDSRPQPREGLAADCDKTREEWALCPAVLSPRGTPRIRVLLLAANDPRARPKRCTRKQPAFVPLVLGDVHAAASITLELRGGRSLRLAESFPVDRLATLVHALEANEGQP